MKIIHSYLLLYQKPYLAQAKKVAAFGLVGFFFGWQMLSVIYYFIYYYILLYTIAHFLQLFLCYIFCFQCHLLFTIVICHIRKTLFKFSDESSPA